MMVEVRQSRATAFAVRTRSMMELEQAIAAQCGEQHTREAHLRYMLNHCCQQTAALIPQLPVQAPAEAVLMAQRMEGADQHTKMQAQTHE